MTVAVRPATPGDLAAVRALAAAFDRHRRAPADEPAEEFRARYDRLLGRDDWLLAVADDGTGDLAGYALAQDYGPALRRGFSTGRLHDLYVAEPRRRRGVGRTLVDAVLAWCAGRPAPMILDWQARLDAVPFYAALGLTPDTVGDHAEFPAFSVDLR